MSDEIEIGRAGTIKINGVEYRHSTIVGAYQHILDGLGLKIERVPVIKTEDEV